MRKITLFVLIGLWLDLIAVFFLLGEMAGLVVFLGGRR